MYKILIVDDEIIERRGLKKILEKQFKELIEIDLAENGKIAIEKVKIFLPDIIFMDIKMPGLNGIETMKEIRKDFPNVNVVIVSAFDSFKYAKEAININAYEYLLKPVKRKDIIRCVDRLIKFDDEKSKNIERREFIEGVNLKSISLIKQNLFDYIISNKIKKIKEVEELKMDIISFNKGVSVIIETKNSKENLLKFIQLFLEKEYGNYLLRKMNDLFVCFIECSDKSYNNNFKNLYINILNQFGIEVKIVFSEYGSIDQINSAYQNNLKKIYNLESGNKKNIYPIKLENELIEKINLNILEESIEILNNIFIWTNKYIDSDNMKLRYLTELEILINRLLFEKLNDVGILKPIDQIESSDIGNIILMKNSIKKKLLFYIEKVLSSNNSNIEDIINNAKLFISNNYMKDITLDMVASEICISTYYFSKLFKKETGINFIDYLTKERIDNAKYLIRNSSKSIKQISSEVGYNDSNYFSRVFKKHTGYSPSIYKKI
jgi:two-component system response regulator YesN